MPRLPPVEGMKMTRPSGRSTPPKKPPVVATLVPYADAAGADQNEAELADTVFTVFWIHAVMMELFAADGRR